MIETIWRRVPSHGPIWRQNWESNEILIVCNNLFSCSFEEEIDVKVSSCCDVAQNRASIFLVRDDWGLCVSISEENTNELTLCSDETEWMNSIRLFTTILSARNFLSDTMGPHCKGTFSKLEVVHSFTKSINVFGWEFHINLHELILYHKCLILSVKYRFTCLWTCEREWERLCIPFETLCFKSVLGIFLLFINNILRDFESCSIYIVVITQRKERSCIARLTKLEADLLNVLIV